MASEFNQEFRDRLLATVLSGELPADLRGALQDDNRFQGIKSKSLRSIVYGFNRLLLASMCYFGRIDLIANLDYNRGHGQSMSLRRKLQRLIDKRTEIRVAKWLWSCGLSFVYIVCVIVLLVSINYQYIYNANTLKLQRLQAHLHETSLSHHRSSMENLHSKDVTALKSELKCKAQEARRILKLMGASHLEWSFTLQSVLLIFILSGINLNLIAPLHYLLTNWQLVAPQLILDPKHESKFRTKLVMKELEAFAINSCALAKTSLDQIGKYLASQLGNEHLTNKTKRSLLLLGDKMLVATGKRLDDCYRHNIDQLKKIALEGRLNPLNRTPACCDKLALMFSSCLLLSTMTVYSIIILGQFRLQAYYESVGVYSEYESLADHLNTISMVFIIIIHANMSLFLLNILIITWFDQIQASRSLHKLLIHVIDANERRFDQLLSLASAQDGTTNSVTREGGSVGDSSYELASDEYHHQQQIRMKLCNAIERDLLTVAIQCRVTVRITQLVRDPLSVMSTSAVWFAGLMLIIFRLHSPYFHSGLRSINLMINLASVAFIIIELIPLGRMHQNCIEAFKVLWSLSAQMSSFESMASISAWLQLDSNVAVFSLRRELADSKERMSRLACHINFISFPVTSQNLITISFWAFLLLLSLSSNINLFGEGFSSFLDDPFSLFGFIKG